MVKYNLPKYLKSLNCVIYSKNTQLSEHSYVEFRQQIPAKFTKLLNKFSP